MRGARGSEWQKEIVDAWCITPRPWGPNPRDPAWGEHLRQAVAVWCEQPGLQPPSSTIALQDQALLRQMTGKLA